MNTQLEMVLICQYCEKKKTTLFYKRKYQSV